MFFAHRWQILLRLSSYLPVRNRCGFNVSPSSCWARSDRPHNCLLIRVWMCTDMDVWIHAILMDYNIWMLWLILVLKLPQIWSVATFADGFRPLSPLNMPGSFIQYFLYGTARWSGSILFFPVIFPSGSGPLYWRMVVRGHDQCASGFRWWHGATAVGEILNN